MQLYIEIFSCLNSCTLLSLQLPRLITSSYASSNPERRSAIYVERKTEVLECQCDLHIPLMSHRFTHFAQELSDCRTKRGDWETCVLEVVKHFKNLSA